MKNILRTFILFMLPFISFCSCNKDQRCVNWLKGKWDITGAVRIDSLGTETDIFTLAITFGGSISGNFTFEKYKVKKEEMGTAGLVFTTTILGQTETIASDFDYRIENDCTTIWVKEKNSSTEDNTDILESSKDKFVVLFKKDDNEYKFTLEKPE